MRYHMRPCYFGMRCWPTACTATFAFEQTVHTTHTLVPFFFFFFAFLFLIKDLINQRQRIQNASYAAKWFINIKLSENAQTQEAFLFILCIHICIYLLF